MTIHTRWLLVAALSLTTAVVKVRPVHRGVVESPHHGKLAKRRDFKNDQW